MNLLPTLRALMLTAFAAVCVAQSGCAIENAIDCLGICNRYKDCYDSNYDVSACSDRCRSNSSNDDYERKVDACNDCLDGKSCAGATFACGAECSSVLP